MEFYILIPTDVLAGFIEGKLRHGHRPRFRKTIAQFAIIINSDVCPHIRVPNMLMREFYADVIVIFNSEARY